jgi:hydroxylamine reductase (hybrid-cluster protein)
MILGSSLVTDIALNVLNDLVGAAFIVEGDMEKTAEILLDIIKKRRAGLGI